MPVRAQRCPSGHRYLAVVSRRLSSRGATSLAFELIAGRGERLSAIVEAARIPTSPAGLARGAHAGRMGRRASDLRQGCGRDRRGRLRRRLQNPTATTTTSVRRGTIPPISRMPSIITAGRFRSAVAPVHAEGKPIASDFVFTQDGERKAHWRCSLDRADADEADLPPKAEASFSGDAEWTDGVNVALTYSSNELSLEGNETLDAAAPTRMDPSSNEARKEPSTVG